MPQSFVRDSWWADIHLSPKYSVQFNTKDVICKRFQKAKKKNNTLEHPERLPTASLGMENANLVVREGVAPNAHAFCQCDDSFNH